MTARDRIHAMLPICDSPTEADTRAQELDARLDDYRTEAIHKAIGRLRAIPVTCTALTGPVWYGNGWNSAIRVLEEIAEYRTPDDEAYGGELQMLRALALGVRVAARKGQIDEVQRLVLAHAAADGDARDKAKAREAAAGFFLVDHTYRHGRWLFRTNAVSAHPGTGDMHAIGWTSDDGHTWIVSRLDQRDWETAGWIDVTGEVTP